jgi:hypothetical protein
LYNLYIAKPEKESIIIDKDKIFKGGPKHEKHYIIQKNGRILQH